MQDKKLLVIGCGKIGGRVAHALSKDFQITGLRRSPQNDQDDICFIATDVCDKSNLENALQHKISEGVDYVLYCLTPSTRDEQSYRETYVEGLSNVLTALPNKQRLKRLIFISSSSVYHQNDDSWVDENSLCQPQSFSGRLILEAESLLINSNIPYTIIRFSGIYGGNRRHLINQVKQSAEIKTPILSKTLRRTNRIHEDDCVGFIKHLIYKANQGDHLESLYLASDNKPVDLNEVIIWLANEIGVTICQEKEATTTRRSGNKKCANKRMLESGYSLHYPDFKTGYSSMLAK